MKKTTKRNVEAIGGYTTSITLGMAVIGTLTDVFNSLSDPCDADTDIGVITKSIRNTATAVAIGGVVMWKWMDAVSSYIRVKYD